MIDNAVRYDFMLLQFSVPVNNISVVITPVGYYDRDVTYYTGNGVPGLNLNGYSLSNLRSIGLGAAVNNDSTSSGHSRTVAIASGNVDSVLFGARVGGDHSADYFKLTSISVTAAPEPGTYALMGSALIGLSFIGRLCKRK